jgi:hypothetical protein
VAHIVNLDAANLALFGTEPEILDNGFGKTYRREDMRRFALWSYAMDCVTFGTMEFHEVMGNNAGASDEV